MTSEDRQTWDDHEELSQLMAQLHETQARIVELTGGKLDAVMHHVLGPNLLPHTQEHLGESDALHRRYAVERAAILDALPANIALLDAEANIAAVNDAWRRFAEANGLTAEQAGVGMNYLSVCENARGPWSERANEIAAGIRKVLGGEAEGFSVEYPCHAPYRKRWFQLLVAPLREGRDGGAVVMHIDVTERKLAESETVRAKDRLETLIREASVGILVHRDFVPLMANEELARIFGYASTAAVMELEDIRTLFAEEERNRVSSHSDAGLRGDDAPNVYTLKGRTLDGAPLDLENRAFPIEWNGETAICAMVTDVTEQKRTLAQLQQVQKLEAIGQLSGGIAHDFNNLLAVILGNAELLSEALGERPDLQAHGKNIETAAERGSELTQLMLAFSRQQGLQPRTLDANELIAGCEKWLARTLGEEIEIENRFASDLWRIRADPGQLESAILNLSINARDAMPGGGRLTFETANVDLDADYQGKDDDFQPGAYVMIAVTDSGEGMSQEVLEKAFEPFFTTKEVGKGTGLGLSMVYGFLKQSGGFARIYSEIGIGTTVRLYIPSVNVEQEETITKVNQADLRRGVETVLVVEDNEMVRDYVVNQFRSLGYGVIEAANGPDALQRLEEGNKPDLLFTDMVMPGNMNGYEVASRALKLQPDIKVIFTTGFTDTDHFTLPEELTACPVLRKPYRRNELTQVLRQALDED